MYRSVPVDRVEFSNRGRVSEENIRRVKEIMEQVGYKPNLIARSLAVKKPCYLVALIPDFRPGDYWSAMEYGISWAEEEWESYGVKVSVLTFDQYSKASFEQAVSRLQEMTETVDGVIVGTLFKEAVIQLSEHLDAREIPYVYVDSDIRRARPSGLLWHGFCGRGRGFWSPYAIGFHGFSGRCFSGSYSA